MKNSYCDRCENKGLDNSILCTTCFCISIYGVESSLPSNFKEKQEVINKPPLGLTPRNVWIQKRFIDVTDAIGRYFNAGLRIPTEWMDEYKELVDDINKYIEE